MEEMGTTPLQQVAASCSGAILSSLLVTPLDVVKVRLQAQQRGFRTQCFLHSSSLMDHLCTCVNGDGQRVSQGPHCPWDKRPVVQFKGSWDAFLKITRYEGVTILWSGLPPTLIMAIPATVIYYTLNDQLRIRLKYRLGADRSSEASMVAGVCARMTVATLVCPLEMIRTKLQSEQIKYAYMAQAIRFAIAKEGYGALYKGYTATLLRDVPFSAIIWYYYDLCKHKLSIQYNVTPNNSFVCISAAGLAGSMAAFATMPFDVIKTRKQIEIGDSLNIMQGGSSTKSINYSTTWEVFRAIVKQHGYTGLFAGTIPRLMRITPACAIMIGTYETLKKYFQEANGRRKNEF